MGSNLSTIFSDPNACSLLYASPSPSSSPPLPTSPPPPSSSSSSSSSSFSSSSSSRRTKLGDLPEGCAALVLRHLDPPEICKLARLNRAFRRASWADFVWDSKLPRNYEAIVDRVIGEEVGRKIGKREIFSALSKANPFDGGSKKAWLDKRTGEVCLSVSAKGLTITGIDDRRYWNHIPSEESRFSSVAYLQQIWWYEVDGQLEFPFPAGTYSLFFRVQLGRTAKRFGRRVCNTEHVHGWDIKPVRFQLWTSDGQHASSQCFLNDTGSWSLYHVGDFVVNKNQAQTMLKFSMTQIDCTHTKGGLCLDSVLVYPGAYKERLKHF